jgi:hypothetical protein
VLEVFNFPGVANPFPIATGPNPVNFDVPGPNTQPSPPRPATTQARSISSIDPLTEGGLVSASAVASDDSLIVPQSTGAAPVVDFEQLKAAAEASVVSFMQAQKLDDELLLGAPTSTGLL